VATVTARIPFALVGVLLLVGSATFAGSLHPPSPTNPSVDDALGQLDAETQSAVRHGVSTGAREAARNPVTRPANTSVGAVLNESDTFRDWLRLRIYVAVRDRLGRLGSTGDTVTVSASLPQTPTPAKLRAAKERVHIERATADGTTLRATVENVTLTARRDGRVVGTRRVSPTVTVPVPTLAVHNRVQRFERLLNAGPGAPGLGRRLTGAMYALTWIRGYAQFGGAPIDNVVTNRHIGLFTNGAVLSMQRAVFGQRDQRGAEVLGWATANTALTDAIDGTDHGIAERLSKAHDALQGERAPAALVQQQQSAMPSASPQDTVTIGINETADRALLETLRDLNETIRRPYRVTVRRQTAVTDTVRTVSTEPEKPGANWSLLRVSVENTTTVTDRDESPRAVNDPWHRLADRHRWVNRTRTIRRTWNTSNGTRATVERRKRAHAVRITLVGRHDGGGAPRRPFTTVHARGGPLDGPNLAGVEASARQKLIDRRGGTAAVARRTVTGGNATVSTTIRGKRPANLSAWVYRDLAALHERVRNVSVTVSKGELATMQVNPARQLRSAFADRRGDFRAIPSRYDGVATRARVGVRVAFLERVQTRLRNRARQRATQQSKLDKRLAETDIGSLESMQTTYENRQHSSPRPAGGDVTMRVNTAPSYLTLGELSGETIPGMPADTAEHPLVAHNRNLFTVPYGDAADAVVDGAVSTGRTRLQTAARVLDAATSRGARKNETATLREEVRKSNLAGQAVLVESLSVVENRSLGERTAVVRAALDRWDGPAATAEALTNGSATVAVRRTATSRWNLSQRTSDRVDLVIERRLATFRSTEHARPQQEPVARHVGTLQRLATSRVKGTVEDGAKAYLKESLARRTGKTLKRLPAGLPVAPVPPYWYLTVNYWEIRVAGEYARFAVSVPRGSATAPGGRFTYVRDGESVELDVDRDGAKETVGSAPRVSFETHTSVAIAVPPKPRGVGDKDGQMNEASPGWPTAGGGDGG
jgi:hypothetical protein